MRLCGDSVGCVDCGGGRDEGDACGVDLVTRCCVSVRFAVRLMLHLVPCCHSWLCMRL